MQLERKIVKKCCCCDHRSLQIATNTNAMPISGVVVVVDVVVFVDILFYLLFYNSRFEQVFAFFSVRSLLAQCSIHVRSMFDTC